MYCMPLGQCLPFEEHPWRNSCRGKTSGGICLLTCSWWFLCHQTEGEHGKDTDFRFFCAYINRNTGYSLTPAPPPQSMSEHPELDMSTRVRFPTMPGQSGYMNPCYSDLQAKLLRCTIYGFVFEDNLETPAASERHRLIYYQEQGGICICHLCCCHSNGYWFVSWLNSRCWSLPTKAFMAWDPHIRRTTSLEMLCWDSFAHLSKGFWRCHPAKG